MSLVGTRPPTVDEYEQYELGHRKRLARVYYCTRNNIAYIKIYKNHINNLKEWEEFILRIVKRIIRKGIAE